MKPIRSSPGKGIRLARLARNLSQEEIGEVSGRTYVSELERGTKAPTVSKMEQFAAVTRFHPITLLTLGYCKTPTQKEAAAILSRVSGEISEILEALAERDRQYFEALKRSES
jgi:transcriptional regulator with XRE-family HTH domain